MSSRIFNPIDGLSFTSRIFLLPFRNKVFKHIVVVIIRFNEKSVKSNGRLQFQDSQHVSSGSRRFRPLHMPSQRKKQNDGNKILFDFLFFKFNNKQSYGGGDFRSSQLLSANIYPRLKLFCTPQYIILT